MIKTKQRIDRIKLMWYEGSLDFPCDFCGGNSYRNYHLLKNGSLKFVVCKDCLDKEMVKND